MAGYDELGAAGKRAVMHTLPGGYSLEGKRILDFGCGAGGTLRHFWEEAEEAEFHGCDVEEEMIAWMGENLCPPIAGAHATGAAPPLPFEDGFFDLVYALSVFTHITVYWPEWILELQRVVKPGGFVVATVLGEAMSELLTPIPWDEDATAMNCFGFGPHIWKFGTVLHSEWWVRTHWGRAFEIVEFQSSGFGGNTGAGHGFVLMSPKGAELTVDDLERDEPGELRYAKARRQNLLQLDHEGDHLRRREAELLQRLEVAEAARSRRWGLRRHRDAR
jgi:SAM-dependent methyltransferase